MNSTAGDIVYTMTANEYRIKKRKPSTWYRLIWYERRYGNPSIINKK